MHFRFLKVETFLILTMAMPLSLSFIETRSRSTTYKLILIILKTFTQP